MLRRSAMLGPFPPAFCAMASTARTVSPFNPASAAISRAIRRLVAASCLGRVNWARRVRIGAGRGSDRAAVKAAAPCRRRRTGSATGESPASTKPDTTAACPGALGGGEARRAAAGATLPRRKKVVADDDDHCGVVASKGLPAEHGVAEAGGRRLHGEGDAPADSRVAGGDAGAQQRQLRLSGDNASIRDPRAIREHVA